MEFTGGASPVALHHGASPPALHRGASPWRFTVAPAPAALYASVNTGSVGQLRELEDASEAGASVFTVHVY